MVYLIIILTLCPIIDYQLSQKLKSLGNCEFNHNFNIYQSLFSSLHDKKKKKKKKKKKVIFMTKNFRQIAW
jgi:Zn-finger protein